MKQGCDHDQQYLDRQAHGILGNCRSLRRSVDMHNYFHTDITSKNRAKHKGMLHNNHIGLCGYMIKLAKTTSITVLTKHSRETHARLGHHPLKEGRHQDLSIRTPEQGNCGVIHASTSRHLSKESLRSHPKNIPLSSTTPRAKAKKQICHF